MPNPPPIALTPPVPQALVVVVTANGVQPDGSNPGSVDTTSALTIEPVQNTQGPSGSTGTPAVIVSIDSANNRRVIMTPAVVGAPGGTGLPWSFRISAAGRTAKVVASGTTASPVDVSGVAWDGQPVGPA